MSGSLLSICIPTFNGEEKLKKCLGKYLPDLISNNIRVYISDNASTDNTRSVIESYAKRYPNIHYHRNSTNVGVECNHEIVLKLSNTKYSWLMGDDDGLIGEELPSLLSALKDTDYDFVIVNGGNYNDITKKVTKRIIIPDNIKIYGQCNEFIEELGWHIIWMSCQIFNQKSISQLNYNKFRGSQIPQCLYILDCISDSDKKILYWPKPIIFHQILSGYRKDTFEIFAKNSYEYIMALSNNYKDSAKLKCIKDIARKPGVFSLKQLLIYRAQGYFDYSIYKKYKRYLPYVSRVNLIVIMLISFLPCPRFVSRTFNFLFPWLYYLKRNLTFKKQL